MRKRIALGVVIAAVGALSLTSSAFACLTADLSVSPSAGPGDPVSFGISGIEPGATYTVTFEGHQVASGTNNTSNNGVSGTFTMPDLGSQAQTVYAYADTVHPEDGDTFHLSKPIAYQPAVSPSTAPPAASSAPATVSSSTHHAQHHARGVSHATPRTSHHSAAAPSTAPIAAPGVDTTGNDAPVSEPTSASSARHHSVRAASSVPDRVLHTLGSTTDVGPAKVPTMGLLLFALIFIAGTALTGFVIYLSQTGPDPEAAIKAPAPVPLDPVEAELQDMIGDEMARQLLSDLELGERVTAGSP